VRTGSARRPAALRRGPNLNAMSWPPMAVPGAHAGVLAQRGDARTRVGRSQQAQARAHQAPVVALEGHHVGHRAQRHQVQPGAQVQLAAERRADAGAQREREARAAHPLERELAAGLMRVEEGQRRQRLVRDQVVVHHDHVHAASTGGGDARVIAAAAVARDDHVRRHREAGGQRGLAEAIAAREAVGDERHHLRAERLQHVAQDGGAGGPVHVVVAEDGHPLAVLRGERQPLTRLRAAAHAGWVGQPTQGGLEVRARRGHLSQVPVQQHLRHAGTQPQLSPEGACMGHIGRPQPVARALDHHAPLCVRERALNAIRPPGGGRRSRRGLGVTPPSRRSAGRSTRSWAPPRRWTSRCRPRCR
jgi:hypothetical protein